MGSLNEIFPTLGAEGAQKGYPWGRFFVVLEVQVKTQESWFSLCGNIVFRVGGGPERPLGAARCPQCFSTWFLILLRFWARMEVHWKLLGISFLLLLACFVRDRFFK